MKWLILGVLGAASAGLFAHFFGSAPIHSIVIGAGAALAWEIVSSRVQERHEVKKPCKCGDPECRLNRPWLAW